MSCLSAGTVAIQCLCMYAYGENQRKSIMANCRRKTEMCIIFTLCKLQNVWWSRLHAMKGVSRVARRKGKGEGEFDWGVRESRPRPRRRLAVSSRLGVVWMSEWILHIHSTSVRSVHFKQFTLCHQCSRLVKFVEGYDKSKFKFTDF